MDDLSTHKQAQSAVADRLSEQAAIVGRRALALSTMGIAQHVSSYVVSSFGRAPLDEASADLAEIRGNARLLDAVNRDVEQSGAAVQALMLQGMTEGFDSEMRWQVTQIPILRWELTPADRQVLHGYPIQGHTVAEISRYMHEQLRYEVSGITTQPLSGLADVSNITAAFGELVPRFANRVAGAVSEAFYAGVQLGTRTVAEAMASAR